MIIDYKTLANTFMLEDIKWVAKKYDIEISHIYNIQSNSETAEEKIKDLKGFVENRTDEELVLTTAFISMDEFPEDKFYLFAVDATPDKKQIPVKEVLEREIKVYEAVGFVNINQFIDYEYKIAFVYPNKIGKRIIDAIEKEVATEK